MDAPAGGEAIELKMLPKEAIIPKTNLGPANRRAARSGRLPVCLPASLPISLPISLSISLPAVGRI
ncbi:hypothetical protein J19TS2_39760 [Cohnella xylanilytica]|nr:hypothetical protein J19TS2_39760 [Cohnella xylanilytica]